MYKSPAPQTCALFLPWPLALLAQGTTQMFAALSDSAAMRERLSVAVMLAPAVFMRFVTSVPAIALASIQMDRVGSQAFGQPCSEGSRGLRFGVCPGASLGSL